MNMVQEIVRNIVAWLLLSSLVELLLPRGALGKPVRLVMGLLLVAGVMGPLATLRPEQADFSLFTEPLPLEADYAAEGAALASALSEQAAGQYQLQVDEQMATVAQLAEGVEQAEAALELGSQGELVRVRLRLELKPGAEPAVAGEQAVNLVSGFYLIAPSLVEWSYREVSVDE